MLLEKRQQQTRAISALVEHTLALRRAPTPRPRLHSHDNLQRKKTELASRDASGPRQCPCGVCPSRGLRQPGERRQGIKACDTGKRRIAKGQRQNSPSTHPPLGTKGDWSQKVTETVQSGQRQIRISFLDSQSRHQRDDTQRLRGLVPPPPTHTHHLGKLLSL